MKAEVLQGAEGGSQEGGRADEGGQEGESKAQ